LAGKYRSSYHLSGHILKAAPEGETFRGQGSAIQHLAALGAGSYELTKGGRVFKRDTDIDQEIIDLQVNRSEVKMATLTGKGGKHNGIHNEVIFYAPFAHSGIGFDPGRWFSGA
jgi:hypothetical protein